MYYLIYGPLYLLSLLPLRVLYVIGDLIYGIIFYIIGYRKKVVMNNLRISFPEKTEKERKKIMKGFYHNFVDTFIETIKLLSSGKEFVDKHVTIRGLDVINDLYQKGKKLQVHLGHNFNWELGNAAAAIHVPYKFLGVYMPIGNKHFNRMFIDLRSRMGTILIPATDMKNAMLPYRSEVYLLGLIADQVPGDVKKAYWLNFFGKATPFARGPERGARAGNTAVVFVALYKTARGKYILDFVLGTEDAGELPEGETTRLYARFLESVIRPHPDMWLWSHRRWKREWKEEYRDGWIGGDEKPG
jgi:KDO2-lipid IV(A) lauroyltransferase